MRVTSLVALAVVILTTLYFIFLTPDWAIDMYVKATGFGPAETPAEAVDKFMKCVKKRDLKTAARFCTGEYADIAKRSAVCVRDMGPLIDAITEFMKNKGLVTDKALVFMHFLDPFPTNFKVLTAPKENKDGTQAICVCDWEPIPLSNKSVSLADLALDLGGADPKMYNRSLMPDNFIGPKGFEIVKEGDSWKLKFIVTPARVQMVEYYLMNYKGYETGLTVFRRELTNDRYASKEDFTRELVSVLHKAK